MRGGHNDYRRLDFRCGVRGRGHHSLENGLMRTVIKDDKNIQVQLDENDLEYHFDKQYIPTGDKRTEYSLILRRVESSVKGESFRSYVGIKDIEAKHYIIIKWPGVR